MCPTAGAIASKGAAAVSRSQQLRHARKVLVASVAALAVLTSTMSANARTNGPAAGVDASSGSDGPTFDDPGSERRCVVTKKLVPECGAWFGVGPNPQGNESYDRALTDFEARIGRTVDISHYFTRGQSTMFPTSVMRNRANEPGRERLLLINWRPTLTWRAIANGAADGYLENLADHIQDVYPDPFFLSLHAEMEAEVNPASGSGMTAADFRDFFRHTVTTLRNNGATSVVTVVNYMGAPHWGLEPWFETLYPGDAYVDWIAEDPYAFGEPPVWRSDFAGTVDRVQPGTNWPGFYTWATTEHPGKPIMLGEWGVDEDEGEPGYKPGYFDDTLWQLKSFPALKALVYWDHPGAPTVGETRVDSSTASLQQFRELVSSWTLSVSGRKYLDRPPTPAD